MPHKAYAIVLSCEDEDNGHLYFPIKRAGRDYGGMPQFFGGTKNAGEADRTTIDREMNEESDGKIRLSGNGGLIKIHSAAAGADRYNFYIVTKYSGRHFLGPLQNAEMASIRKFFVQIDQEDGIEQMLRALGIVPTEDFSQSQTYVAFDKAIRWSEGQA